MLSTAIQYIGTVSWVIIATVYMLILCGMLTVLLKGKLSYYAHYEFFSERLYDEKNKLLRETTENRVTTFQYDKYGDLSAFSHNNGYSISYDICREHCKPEYGKVIHSKDSNGEEIFYEYDSYGRLINRRRNGDSRPFETFEYPKDLPGSKNASAWIYHPLEQRNEYTYNKDGYVTAIDCFYSKSNYPLAIKNIEVDRNGNTTCEKEYIDSILVQHIVYAYNANNEMVYSKDVLKNDEKYYVYIDRKQKKGGHSRICLVHNAKDN